MRTLFALFVSLACLASICTAEDAATDQETAKPTIEFDGQTLQLAFEGNDPGEQLKEFIPAGETLDHWTKLAAIREYPTLNDPEALVQSVANELHKQYPDSPSKITKVDDDNVVIDFVVWPPDVAFVEFNVFKYSKLAEGGIECQQYALRAYGQDGQDFLKGLRAVREKLVPLMTKDGLEVSE